MYTYSDALSDCGFSEKLKYDAELEIKQKALELFFTKNKAVELNALLAPIVPSPKTKGYRTTTKRRGNFHPKYGFNFGVDQVPFADPKEHDKIYRFIEAKLKTPPYMPLAQAINWVIIRGSYTNRAVIFNIQELSAPIVRKLKLMADHLKQMQPAVSAAHVYVAEKSDYYMELEQPTGKLNFKQLFGPKELGLKLADCSLKYPVTGFSQINESQVGNMLGIAAEMAQLNNGVQFMDLYCGYGLFAFGIGHKAESVMGVEWTGESIECAKRSAAFLKRNAQFVTGQIDAKFIQRIPKATKPEVILLDPPRKGTLPGVIEAVAKRRPLRVIHIFCGTDEIPRSIAEWNRMGYSAKSVRPLDMFPGNRHMETLILLEADK